ncbi:MAG: shikimate dehydrogenase [Pseudohongiellaceae bacterium]
MKKLGVVGHPIAHSKSPAIQLNFAAQCNVAIEYEKYNVAPLEFRQFIKTFFDEGGHGLNITVPFKEIAFELSTPANQRVSQAKAVNTLYLDSQGKLVGNNTDGPGFVKDLENNSIALKDKSVLLLGAGGAVRGILPSLIDKQCGPITVANRTLENASKLRQEFLDYYPIEVCSFENVPVRPFDLIINGTSMGLTGETPLISPAVIGENTACYDLMYSSSPTAFIKWCLENNAKKAVDGLGMLVEQAAESFNIWMAETPETQKVIAEMKSQ